MSQDRSQENRFRPFLYHSLSLWPWGKTVTSRLLKVKSWRISNIISRQVKINNIRFIFFPDRMLINPLPHDDVHAEGDTGSKTDQLNSTKKYVTKTIKNRDTTTGTRILWDSECCCFGGHPNGDTTGCWPYSHTLSQTLLQVTGGRRMPDYMDLWRDHFCVLTSTFNLLAWEVLLLYLLQNEIHLFDELGKYWCS